MKKILMAGWLLTALALLAACGGQDNAEESPAPETEETEALETQPGTWEGENILFESDFGWSLELPACWEGRYEVITTADSETFCVSACADQNYSGTLFTVSLMDSETADETEEIIPVARLAEREDGLCYLAVFPSDVPYDLEADSAAQYEEMHGDVESVLATFTLVDEGAGA